MVDTDNDGVPDVNVNQNTSGFTNQKLNGLPVAGNFAAAHAGDEVGIFNGTSWLLDTNGDYILDREIVSALRGYPIVGDFDGDGLDDLGAWSDDRFQFDLANNGLNGTVDATILFGFIGVRERPVAADMDQDGIDDVGLWTPDRSGVTPGGGAEWYFLVSNDATGANRITGTVNTLNHAFEPKPFSKDLYIQLGNEFALPIVGNFDPPSAVGPIDFTPGEEEEVRNRLDVNQDGFVSPVDVLIVINDLTTRGPQPVFSSADRLLDVSNDGFVSALDVLQVINYLNAFGTVAAEGEGASLLELPVSNTIETVELVTLPNTDSLAATPFTVFAAADSSRLTRANVHQVFASLDDEVAETDDLASAEDSSASDLLFAEMDDDTLLSLEDVRDTATPADELFAELGLDAELYANLAADVSDAYRNRRQS
jgi:hypothetical protein